MKSLYKGTGGGSWTDNESGGLGFLLISDEATNAPSIQSYTRVRFIDN